MTERIKHSLSLLAVVGIAAYAQTSVTTQHNDIARTGANTNETILAPSNVNTNTFGKLFSAPVDGRVYAQPLYMPGVTVGTGTAQANTTHNVVFVATEHDSVIAFDADSNTRANASPLWQVSLIDAAHGAGPGETTVLPGDLSLYDVLPEIGITSTPVIDPASNTIYVVAKSAVAGTTFIQRLHALDITTGQEKFGGPVQLSGSVPGNGTGSSGGTLNWDPMWENNRTGLLLLNGIVYIGFGSHQHNGPSHGWILAYSASSLEQTGVWCASPNAAGAGIWMSGTGLAADVPPGKPYGRIFTATGNGTFDAVAPNYTNSMDYGDSIIELDLANGLPTMMSNGTTVGDDFTPLNQAFLNANDWDQASGGVVILPDSVGGGGDQLVQVGKSGIIYVLNRENLGGYNPNNKTDPGASAQVGGLWGAPAYWNGTVYVWTTNVVGTGSRERVGTSNNLMAFGFANRAFASSSPSSTSAEFADWPSPTPSISANGTTNGIVWSIRTDNYPHGQAILYAHDAANVATLLYSSESNVARDNAGNAIEFVVPTVVNGKVYVGTESQLSVYGLLEGATQAATPTFNPASVAGGTGLISGTPTTAGTSRVPLNGINSGGRRKATLTLAPATAATASFVQTVANAVSSSASSFSLSFPANTVAGDVILVAFDYAANAAPSSVTDTQGNVFATIGNQLTSPGGTSSRVYYAANIKGGADTVKVSLSASSAYIELYLSEYSGVAQTNPIDVQAGASGGAGAVSSGNATTTVAGDVIYGYCVGDGSCTAGSGFTTRSSFNANLTEDMTAGSAGTYAAAGTANHGWTMQMVALKPSSVAVGAPAITSATMASGTVGTAFSYQITATNTPTSYAATGLPAGLSVNSTTGVISGTPTAAGTSTVTLSATNAGGTGKASLTLTIGSVNSQFITLSSNGKYLVNSFTGQPVFLTAEDCWGLAIQLDSADATTYLRTRSSQGYNACWMAAVDNTYQSNPPYNFYGNAPFSGADFTNENPAYWTQVDQIISVAASYGITVFLSPAFAGSYYTSYVNSSAATVQAYGAWLGSRYASSPNIVWVLGGDARPSITGLYAKLNDLALGIRSTDTNHLMTLEACDPYACPVVGTTSSQADWTSANVGTAPATLNLNWIYDPQASVQVDSAENYARSGAWPQLLGESGYENNGDTALQLRETGYWGVLSGDTLGYVLGNNPIWCFNSTESADPCYNKVTWQSQLTSNGSITQQWLGQLMRSREFWLMVPDSSNTVLTGGYGSGSTISVASCTSDGQTCIVYDPIGNSQAPQIGMSHFTSTVQAWWFNPQTGAITNLGTFSNTGTHTFAPPDGNDWVLTLDLASANLGPPGLTIAVGAPAITSVTTASGTVGTAFSYQITATKTPTSYAASGLPAGLSVSSTTGLISGTPTTAGTSTVILSATNVGGTGNATLTLTIAAAAPAITSATTASGTVGTAFSYQITATNTPTSYAATGLPAGLSVSSTTGLISGTPTAAGTSAVTLSATNGSGTGNATLTLTIGTANAAVSGGWTYLQNPISRSYVNSNNQCTITASTCTLSVAPLTAGSVVMINAITSNNVTITSAKVGSQSATLCASNGCHVVNSGYDSQDSAYLFTSSSNAGATTATINLSGAAASSGGFFYAQIAELLPPTCGSSPCTPAFDTFTAFPASGSNICESCTFPTVSPSATDGVFGMVDSANDFTGSNAASASYGLNIVGNMLALNLSSPGTALTGTQWEGSQFLTVGLMAFKSSAGTFTATPSNIWSIINPAAAYQVMPPASFARVSCTPACPALTIPSTGSGHLLFMHAYGLASAYGHLSSVSGGGSWVIPTGAKTCQITWSFGAISCGWVLSSASGVTTVTPTMSVAGTYDFAIYEVSKSSGSITLDAQGVTYNGSASRTPSGQSLTLTKGTSADDACFQQIFANGSPTGAGAGNVTLYTAPWGQDLIEWSQNTPNGVATAALLNTNNGAAPIWQITPTPTASIVSGVCFQ